MHVPNPLGGYPLILRDKNTASPRKGELVFDYETDDLMYVNKDTGDIKSIASIIRKKILAAKVANAKITVCNGDGSSTSIDPIIPEIKDRKVNTWYYNVTSRTNMTD